MDAAEGLELFRLEALHADRQTIDATPAVVGELGLLEGAGVGLQGDLDIRLEADFPLQAFENAADGAGGEQAGGAAAEEDRAQLAAVHMGQIGMQVGEQRGDVFVFRQFRAGGVGVEVAVRAFAHAPGDVDVGRQGRQLEAVSGKRQAVRALTCGLRLGACRCLHNPNRCLSRAIARARWLMRFLSSAASSALEHSRSGTQNSGS
ncbi:hypothetical protein D3C76_1186870 [compost metagenome]